MTWVEVKEFIEAAASPWTLLLAVALFGFVPVFSVRMAVLLYPAGHPRRAELVAELYKLGRLTRLFFAAEVIATALVEGVGERCKANKLTPTELRQRRRYVRNARYVVAFSGGAAFLSILVPGIEFLNHDITFDGIIAVFLSFACHVATIVILRLRKRELTNYLRIYKTDS